MTYQVVIVPNALTEIANAYNWLAVNVDESTAIKWYDGLIDGISTLSDLPKRCPLAPEAREFEQEIRQLLVGKKRSMYRVLFEVEADTVYVLHVRHGRQSRLNRDKEP